LGRYDIIPAIEESQLHEGSVWDKIPLIGEALDMRPRYEWILFVDFDTLFTNLSISIEDFLHDAERHHLRGNQRWSNVSMIASADWYHKHSLLFYPSLLYFRARATKIGG